MKTLITSIALIFFSGLVLAGSDMSMHKKDRSNYQGQSYPQERTAQQPGIGDGTNRLDKTTSVDDFFDRDEWSVISEEDIYGSF